MKRNGLTFSASELRERTVIGMLAPEKCIFENIVCSLDLRTHDLENFIGMI